MITFLVGFGFAPRYVLSRDLLTIEGMYASAMRCKYLDKSEDLMSTFVASAQGFNGAPKKGDPPVLARLKEWAKITGEKLAGAAGKDVRSLSQDLKRGKGAKGGASSAKGGRRGR